jgi:hypothetical protein
MPLSIVALIGVGAALVISFGYPLLLKVSQIGWDRAHRPESAAEKVQASLHH